MIKPLNLFPAALSALLFAGNVSAQDAETFLGLAVELNAATAAESGCTLSFLITNGYETSVEKAVFETVLFDKTLICG